MNNPWLILERDSGAILGARYRFRGDAITVASQIQSMVFILGWRNEVYTVMHKNDPRFHRGGKF